jgi:hypothetical protein
VTALPSQCWQWRYQGNVCCGMMSLSSHVGDGIAEEMLAMAQCRCRVMLGMELPRRHWPWHDVIAESCWQCHCQSNVSSGAMSLPCHASNGAAEVMLVVALPTTMLT